MTLIECMMALALSAVIMAGLSDMLGVAFASYRGGEDLHRLRSEAGIAMQRVSNAIELAVRRKKQDLTAKTANTTGDWLHRFDPIKNQAIVFRYEWDSANKSLREFDGDKQPVVILSDVTAFKAEALNTSSEVALITISFTVGSPPNAITVSETRRLGGPW